MVRIRLHQRLRYKLRTLLVLLIFAALLMAYVGSYWRLSRRGMSEAARNGHPEFWLFVPLEDMRDGLANDRWDFLVTHQFRRVVYMPLSWVDVHIVGGRPPVIGGTWGLSDDSDDR